MSEFKPGEVAILYLCTPRKGALKKGHPPSGSECTLREMEVCAIDGAGWVCVFPGYPNPDYPDGSWWVPEYMLRKRRPPEQPAEDWFIEDLNRVLRKTRETVAQ